ncbi:molybdopterin converting factor subunit 1 [Corticicoccus populi]|uniref:Molybdopterin synthase sulfur carrier subunit n=1 Tax=Corticicoccus populi TaxID=1812821 RepID=A0ABW5WU28_9STAP
MEILLFAGLKEKVGSSRVSLDIDREISVEMLKSYIYEEYPELDGEVFQVASNESFVRDDYQVSDSDEIALIPPVSGG